MLLTKLGTVLAGSTWAYPVIGGLHVLGIAWFGGAVLLASGPRRWFLSLGSAFMLLTGLLLFVIEPSRCLASPSFLVKLVFLAALAVTRRVRSELGPALTLTLWAAVLFASRGIAFF